MDLTTAISSYKSFHSIADAVDSGFDDVLTDFVIGKPTGAVDLLTLDGAGKHLKVNNFSVIVYATVAANGNTLTEVIYGAAEGGGAQHIASIVWTIGTAQATSTATTLWADTAVVTSTHMRTITVADGGGSNRICSVTFDLTGYRYVVGHFTVDTNDVATAIALYRSF